MMGTLMIDSLEALGPVVSARAPVVPDGPDFAVMIASVVQTNCAPEQQSADRQQPLDGADANAFSEHGLQASQELSAGGTVLKQVRHDSGISTSAPPVSLPVIARESVTEGRGLPKPKLAHDDALPTRNFTMVVPEASSGLRPSDVPRQARDCGEQTLDPPESKQDGASNPAVAAHILPFEAILPPSGATLAVRSGDDFPPPMAKPKRGELAYNRTIERGAEGTVSQPPVAVEAIMPRVMAQADTSDPVVAPITDARGALPQAVPTVDKPIAVMPDRAPTFSAPVFDSARDVLSLTTDKDVRFNVRPETLGPVAVTIEHGEAGPSLRLGVETQAAVQAVRQAEPMMNDVRGAVPFVQVSVDLNSPDGRGRSARAAAIHKRGRDEISDQIMQRATVASGRYA